jgi:hypothetical protein
VDGDTWTFSGETQMAGKLIRNRTVIKLISPDTAVLHSELSVDGGPWAEVMELKGTRVK